MVEEVRRFNTEVAENGGEKSEKDRITAEAQRKASTSAEKYFGLIFFFDSWAASLLLVSLSEFTRME